MAVDLRKLVRAQAEGKAFNPSPAWEDPGRPVGFVDLNLGRLPGVSPSIGVAGQRRKQAAAKTYTSGYGGKQAMDWVSDCVRYYADTVATAEYHFEKTKKKTAVKMPGEPAEAPADLEKLFKDPNPYQDYIEMMELIVMDLLLVGNAYIFKWQIRENGRPLALYRLAPPYIEVATGPWGPKGYIYQIPNADRLSIEDPTEVIHLRLGNPDSENPYFGCGIIQAAGRAADLEIALTHTQASYYENRAMPSVAIESERRVPRDVFKKMRAQLRARAQGPKNAGELLVLEAGLKMNSVAPDATQAAFEAVSKFSMERIFGWFRMHPVLVGIADPAPPAGFISEIKQQWDNTAARPFMDRIHNKLTSELVEPAWNLEYVIDYEYQLTPEDRAKLSGSVGQLPGITVDEARKIGGYGPHPEKDIGKMTLNLPGEEGGTGQPGDPSRKGFPDRNLPGEKGRPPKAGNTKAFPKSGSALPAGAAARRGKALSVDEVSERLDNLIKSPPERQPVDQLQNLRESHVDEVVGSFTSDLTSAARVLERGLLDTVEGKAFDANTVLERLRKSNAWQAFDDFAKHAYEEALLRVMSAAAIHHDKLGMKPAGEIDYQKLVDELVERKDSGVAAITGTLRNDISKAVGSERTSTSTKAEIDTVVQGAITKWVKDKAEMIALTEATRGYNAATLAVADSSGGEKVFVTDGDEDDQPCIEANGSTWTLEYAKNHILEHPRCRRAFVPIS